MMWEPEFSDLNGVQLLRIAVYQQLYIETRNPLFIWAARETASQLDGDISKEIRTKWLQWIDDYLNVCAASLLNHVANQPSESANACIARALGFDPKPGPGQGTAFSEMSKTLRDEDRGLQVLFPLIRERGQEKLAWEALARENGESPTTWGNAWRKFKQKNGILGTNKLWDKVQ
jgi:hypothetical protein